MTMLIISNLTNQIIQYHFDMPFDWSPDYVDLVQVVHEEVRVPKTFTPYAEGKQFKGIRKWSRN